jgi:hypothetical protein
VLLSCVELEYDIQKGDEYMAEAARIAPLHEQNATEQHQETGRKQLPGESALWYRRYILYRDLGRKRSLKAAVTKERETMHLVKEHQKAPESNAGLRKRGKQKTVIPPPVPDIQVPGSWKQACKVFRWVERAKAYDAWLLHQAVELTYQKLGDSLANKFNRLTLLDTLTKKCIEQLNHACDTGATHKTYLAYMKQLSAMLAQIERESSTLGEDMKASIEAHVLSIWDEVETAYHAGKTSLVIKY